LDKQAKRIIMGVDEENANHQDFFGKGTALLGRNSVLGHIGRWV
jgi:hypothetical protein